MINAPSSYFIKFSIIAILLLTSGCSTLFNNRLQSVDIRTTKNQTAMAEIHAPKKTPYEITLPKIIYARPSSYEPFSIKLIDPCFKSIDLNIKKSIHPSSWANIFNYFIGFPLDYVTGYMWEYEKSVFLPLIPNQNTDAICIEKHANLIADKSLSPFNDKPIKHQINIGMIFQPPSRRYSSTDVSAGFFIEYSHKIQRELTSSIKWSYDGSDVDHDSDDCSRFYWNCTDTISTNTHTFAFSLRHYINKKSNFYTGLGIAQNFTSQTINNASDQKASVASSSTFFSLGWQSRRHNPAFHLNATIDFSELHLASPKLHYFNKRNDLDSESLNNKANKLLKNAGLTTHISLGVTAGF